MIRQKNSGLFFTQKVVDQLIVYGTWLLSYFLRFETDIPGTQQGLLSWYVSYGFLLVVLSVYFFKNEKIYKSKQLETLPKEILAQIKANFVSVMVFVVLTYFLSTYKMSRTVVLFYFLASTTLLVFSKVVFRKLFSKRTMKLIMAGTGKAAHEYLEKVDKLKNIELLHWYDKDASDLDNLTVELVENKRPDLIVLGYDNKDYEKVETVLKRFSEELVPVVVLPDTQHSLLGYEVQDFLGQPMMVYNEPNFKSFSLFLKRLMDVLATGIGMIVISPLLLTIAALVKLTSKGPIFYGQVRMGVDGTEFKMWKFRSMVTGSANKEGWTVKNDPRVTRIGSFLRKTSLDELPQLWNVFVGDMSLVGPRPERPIFVNKFRHEIPAYMLRHKMKAGITGWAQVNGWRGDTSIAKRIECDLYYIRNWSLWLDISILFMTFWKGFINKNAY